MKKYIKKTLGFSQFLLCMTAMQASSATINLSVGTNTARCGTEGNKAVTYEINDVRTPPATVPGTSVPTFARPLEYNSGDSNLSGSQSCSILTRAYGESGVIGVSGVATNSFGNSRRAEASARLQADDISIIPKFGRSYAELGAIFGPDISVQANITLSGTIFANGGATSSLIATTLVSGTNSFGVAQPDSQQIVLSTTGRSTLGETVNASFALGEQSPFVTITNPSEGPILIDPTRPLSISFALGSRLNVVNTALGFGDGAFNSYNSLSFDPNGPAFEVPEGFTVNAPSLGIFDNQWIDPRIAVVDPTQSAVPLPASSLLLLAALGSLAALHTRRL